MLTRTSTKGVHPPFDPSHMEGTLTQSTRYENGISATTRDFSKNFGGNFGKSSGQDSRFIRLGDRRTPRLQIHPPQQVLEARVVADRPGLFDCSISRFFELRFTKYADCLFQLILASAQNEQIVSTNYFRGDRVVDGLSLSNDPEYESARMFAQVAFSDFLLAYP